MEGCSAIAACFHSGRCCAETGATRPAPPTSGLMTICLTSRPVNRYPVHSSFVFYWSGRCCGGRRKCLALKSSPSMMTIRSSRRGLSARARVDAVRNNQTRPDGATQSVHAEAGIRRCGLGLARSVRQLVTGLVMICAAGMGLHALPILTEFVITGGVNGATVGRFDGGGAT